MTGAVGAEAAPRPKTWTGRCLLGLMGRVSRLSFATLYRISDVLSGLLYYVLRYRRRVVYDNLHSAFPDLSETEIRHIARAFYRHLADALLETSKLARMDVATLRERMRVKNPEPVEDCLRQGGGVILLCAHYGNWEWMLALWALRSPGRMMFSYKPLAIAPVDEAVKAVRQRFGGRAVESGRIYRTVLEVAGRGIPTLTYMVVDQAPGRRNRFWTRFLHRDTAFFVGAERLARRTGQPVFWLELHKPARGFYELELKLLSAHPQDEPPFAVSERYARCLERAIRARPELWLWSHRRWKRGRSRAKAVDAGSVDAATTSNTSEENET
jgi:KDO2-lipid IV(A) lauroyltransferase